MNRPYRPKSKEEIRRNMGAIRSTENKVEAALRRRLHSRGIRYRKYSRSLPGHPDIVFSTERVAIFVDGDYWHCRTLVEEGLEAFRQRLRTTNRDYWIAKCQKRVIRDQEITATLATMGWLVLRFWESDVKKDIDHAADSIQALLRKRRSVTRRK